MEESQTTGDVLTISTGEFAGFLNHQQYICLWCHVWSCSEWPFTMQTSPHQKWICLADGLYANLRAAIKRETHRVFNPESMWSRIIIESNLVNFGWMVSFTNLFGGWGSKPGVDHIPLQFFQEFHRTAMF